MGNTAYTRSRGMDRDDEDAGEIETNVAPQPAGILSTPGRAFVLGLSVVMLLFVFSTIIYLLSQRTGKVSPQPPNGSVIGIQKGNIAPDFDLVDVRTNQHLKLSSLRGKPVFVNFWGTWCPPCKAEMPEIQKEYSKYKGEVEMVGVSMAPRDTPELVKNFVEQYGYGWTFVHEPDYSTDQSLSLRYQVQAVPSSYFIDKNGVIQAVQIGGMTGAMMDNFLQRIRTQ